MPRRESHTYGEADELRAPIQGRSSGRLGPGDQQHDGVRMVEKTNPRRNSKLGSHGIQGEREREIGVSSKARGTPLYKGARGLPNLSGRRCRTNPTPQPALAGAPA